MADEFIAKRIIEGILFLSPNPLSIKDIASLTGFKPALISFCLKELMLDYETRGIQIAASAGAYRLVTAPDIAPYVEKLRGYVKGVSLSRAAMETLSIIAYRQPVTRAEIEEIRGVNSDGIISKLLDMKLVRIRGRADRPGKPVLLGTTKTFLETFGLNELKDLPRPDDVEPENEEETPDKKTTD